MQVYVFGNEDVSHDNAAIKVAKVLSGTIPNVAFVFVKPNEDLPFAGNQNVVLMDTVLGVDEVRLLENADLDTLILNSRTSVHDFDLGFQLRYLKKLGLLEKVTLIALPMQGDVDYTLIQSILRKLVAQDIHGS